MNIKVAIIGAGPSGLAQLRAFKSLADKGVEIPEIVCFEKQSNWGGLWNYTWRTGLDENGEIVHSSMYRYLWSNGPKECLEFADYYFTEHFDKPIASYPPRAVLFDYIEGRAYKANIRDKIRFNSAVKEITFCQNSKKFNVRVQDFTKDISYSEEFDYVVVASGHFSTPEVPEYSGFSGFNGRIMHAHDFRDALEFKNKDVLIVGSSYSAEDIGSQCYKYGAKTITSSYRSAPMGFKWPNNWQEKPGILKVDVNTVHFIDGSKKDVDAIILCTGYKHHFPFLSESLRLKTKNILYPLGLYKGVIWEDNNQLIYLGMQDQWYTFNMFDAQAWYARDFILGKIKLPTKAEMKKHSRYWHELETKEDNADYAIKFQGDYINMLINETDYPNFDIKGIRKIFLSWKKDKKENIMQFRDKSYPSIMTGIKSPAHHTPWIDALDDSIDSYLKDK